MTLTLELPDDYEAASAVLDAELVRQGVVLHSTSVERVLDAITALAGKDAQAWNEP